MKLKLIMAGICAIASPLLAQTTQPSSGLRPLLPSASRSPSGGPLQPQVFQPGVTSDNVIVQQPSTQPADTLIRDGSMVVRRRGQLMTGADGKTVELALDAVGDAPAMRLVVLPNLQRAAMEKSQGDAKFWVTGLVTTYNQTNYLLVDSASAGSPGPDSDAVLAGQQQSPANTPLAVPPAPAAGPSTRPIPASMPADKVLDQMLQPRTGASAAKPLRPTGTGPVVDTTTGPGAVAPGATSMNVLREGTFIVDRTGRISRGADGQSWEFTFEADGRAMKDPPLVILPNLKLMTMEQAVKSSNRDLRFRVTGMATEYNGRNYLLIEKVVVVPEITQQF